MTPLMLAVLNNNVDIAKLLLRHGANINYQTPTDGMTPLHVATQYGHFESIKLLVNNRVNLNHKTKKVS